MNDNIDKWLHSINDHFDKEKVPFDQRAWLAKWEWAKDKDLPLNHDTKSNLHIDRWFSNQIPLKSNLIGPIYYGTYFNDNDFYPIMVPLAFGVVRIDMDNSFKSMSYRLYTQLKSIPTVFNDMVGIWAACLDYGFGINELLKGKRSSKFINSAHQEIRATVSLLLEKRPNNRAMQSARMAIEMFLKGFIDLKVGLEDSEARAIGHDLSKGITKCLILDPGSELNKTQSCIENLPGIFERYEGKEYPLNDLNNAYRIAQFIGSTIVRNFTDRDTMNLLQFRDKK
jgi:hypothetical protein